MTYSYCIVYWRLWYTSDDPGDKRGWPHWPFNFECTRRMQSDTIVIVQLVTCDFTHIEWQPTVSFSNLCFGVIKVRFCLYQPRMLIFDSLFFLYSLPMTVIRKGSSTEFDKGAVRISTKETVCWSKMVQYGDGKEHSLVIDTMVIARSSAVDKMETETVQISTNFGTR